MATVSCLVTNIPQNIFFCVWEKKETHTGLEQHDGVWMMIKLMKLFLGWTITLMQEYEADYKVTI